MKIVGLLSGHDCSYCVLEDGIPKIHNELERFIREIRDNRQYNLYLSLITDPRRGYPISAFIVKGLYEFFLTKFRFK